MPRFDSSELLVCSCGSLMLPNISTEDSEGYAWYCLKFGCGDYSASELEAEDLEALGVPSWLASSLANLVEKLTS